MRTLSEIAKLAGHDRFEWTWTFGRHVDPLPVQHDDASDADDGLHVWCALTKNTEQKRSHGPRHATVGSTRLLTAAGSKSSGCSPHVDSNQATEDVSDVRLTFIDKGLQKFETVERNAAGNIVVTGKAAVIT